MKSTKSRSNSTSTGDVFADLERAARGEPPEYLPSLSRAMRGERNEEGLSADEEAELRRRITTATFGG